MVAMSEEQPIDFFSIIFEILEWSLHVSTCPDVSQERRQLGWSTVLLAVSVCI
jgi:hypothetical protein